MKKIFLPILILALSMTLVNCHGHKHDHSHDLHEHSHEPLNIVAYGDSIEVFAEVGKLHTGEETFILAYITNMNNFKPVDADEVVFTLTAGGKSVKSVAKKISQGIYRCNIN